MSSERVTKFGTKWVVAFARGDRWVIPAHTGNVNAPLAYVGRLEDFAHLGYVYTNERDARKRAAELFPLAGSAFDKWRKAA